ncbi:MAG: hypothetical protein BGO21_00140 [Dyadobacter sp. 50-39]|uniref:hypothetical protein n=1 Tax=Dyadobacter sp. 50-39 TaxID=1895756 RepID=UPI00095CCF8A|nr:hypothetical protein [Dyadobacter sp. 50-39]OJV15151.1 MAG: hypothetical protein BGO21_00140 [Dyadobacter sp. 50-39]
MYSVVSFPSLIQATYGDHQNSANSLIDGLKIKHGDHWYLTGAMALQEGESPRRSINAMPDSIEYQVLLKAALLLAAQVVRQPGIVTIGAPSSVIARFLPIAKSIFSGSIEIACDGSVFGHARSDVQFDLSALEVIPEIVGCTIGLRKGADNISGNFFVLNCGFGTFESGLSTDQGMVERSIVTAHGFNYALSYVSRYLRSSFGLDFVNIYRLDSAIIKGHMIINRQRVDLTAIRREAIRVYYQEIVSPALRNIINDDTLALTNRIYLCGGAVLYPDLVDMFMDEFNGIADIQLVLDPQQLAAKGYLLNSLRVSNGERDISVGIDLGNSGTRIATFESN